MDEDQKGPIEADDLNASLARAADPTVHMEIVVFGFAQNGRGDWPPPVEIEHSGEQSTRVVPMPPTSAASDDQQLRDELLGNDSLGG
jgi:hypothetical protein